MMLPGGVERDLLSQIRDFTKGRLRLPEAAILELVYEYLDTLLTQKSRRAYSKAHLSYIRIIVVYCKLPCRQESPYEPPIGWRMPWPALAILQSSSQKLKICIILQQANFNDFKQTRDYWNDNFLVPNYYWIVIIQTKAPNSLQCLCVII
jgi:hypothetical protein